MSKYHIFAGGLVLLIVGGALIRCFIGTLFPSVRQEREDQEAFEEAYGDASLLDRDGGWH